MRRREFIAGLGSAAAWPVRVGNPVVDDLLKNAAGPEDNVAGTTTVFQSFAGKWLEKELMKFCALVQILCISLVVWIGGASPVSSAARNVFVLFDERLDLPGVAALDAELVATLRSKATDDIQIYREAMDLSRFNTDTYEILLRDFLRSKYTDKKIDVVVAAFGPALDFLLRHGETIFPGAPIVFCATDKDELGHRQLPPYVRGIFIDRAFAPTLELALGLHPQTKRVTVIAGTSEYEFAAPSTGERRIPKL